MTNTDIHALRVMHFFIIKATTNGYFTAADIVQFTEPKDLSPSYTSKVCQRLTQAGLLESHRGSKGGFKLKIPNPTIAAILNAVGDTPKKLQQCPLHKNAVVAGHACCGLMEAREPFASYIHTTTFKESS